MRILFLQKYKNIDEVVYLWIGKCFELPDGFRWMRQWTIMA